MGIWILKTRIQCDLEGHMGDLKEKRLFKLAMRYRGKLKYGKLLCVSKEENESGAWRH